MFGQINQQHAKMLGREGICFQIGKIIPQALTRWPGVGDKRTGISHIMPEFGSNQYRIGKVHFKPGHEDIDFFGFGVGKPMLNGGNELIGYLGLSPQGIFE